MALMDGREEARPERAAARPPAGSPRRWPPRASAEAAPRNRRRSIDADLHRVATANTCSTMDFEAMSRRRDRRGQARDPPPRPAARPAPHPPASGPTRTGPIADLRAHHPRQPAPRRGDLRPRPHPPHHPPAAAGGAVRHLRLDGALRADPAAFPARGDERPRPGARVPVRHPADQHHPPAAPSRPGGGVPDGRPRGARLVRRHPHRRGAGAVQPRSGRAACWARARWCC